MTAIAEKQIGLSERIRQTAEKAIKQIGGESAVQDVVGIQDEIDAQRLHITSWYTGIDKPVPSPSIDKLSR